MTFSKSNFSLYLLLLIVVNSCASVQKQAHNFSQDIYGIKLYDDSVEVFTAPIMYYSNIRENVNMLDINNSGKVDVTLNLDGQTMDVTYNLFNVKPKDIKTNTYLSEFIEVTDSSLTQYNYGMSSFWSRKVQYEYHQFERSEKQTDGFTKNGGNLQEAQDYFLIKFLEYLNSGEIKNSDSLIYISEPSFTEQVVELNIDEVSDEKLISLVKKIPVLSSNMYLSISFLNKNENVTHKDINGAIDEYSIYRFNLIYFDGDYMVTQIEQIRFPLKVTNTKPMAEYLPYFNQQKNREMPIPRQIAEVHSLNTIPSLDNVVPKEERLKMLLSASSKASDTYGAKEIP
ncbi:MAG: hypothetical protein WD361_14230 [Gracilimonas sp.]